MRDLDRPTEQRKSSKVLPLGQATTPAVRRIISSRMRHLSWLYWLLTLAAFAQETAFETWAKKHHIELVTDPTDLYPLRTTGGTVTGKKPSQEQLENYLPLALSELRKYPDAFVRKLSLKKVVIAEELQFGEQKRAAIPDFQNAILHLDPEEGCHSKHYQRTVLHHEIFHIVDLKDDGELYEDQKWKALNASEFQYGNGGKNARGNDQWQLDDALQGFLNKYSMSGVEEDKAEIYCNMIVRPTEVRKRLSADPILAKKVKKMKEILRSYCREMTDAFWKSIED